MFNVYLNTLRLKGYLAYEYNPFYNYQTDVDLYKIDNQFIVPVGHAVNTKNGEILTNKGTSTNPIWVDKRGNIIEESIKIAEDDGQLYAKSGSIIDLDTESLNFDLNHPVDIEVLPSYDGSVNLILNDDKNIPRIINSRFSAREKNTYEIVDRIGENDTNIYNSGTFDKDTSLYFLYEYNPSITYVGFIKGNLPVGSYCFYFTYCDADENESDYIAESGLIPVFIGSDSDPNSIDGGIKNQNSNKGIRLKLTNLDKSYNYLKIYYVRYFSDYNLNRTYECKKLYLKFPIKSSISHIQITGNEEVEDIDANILNIEKFNPKSILTQTLCLNMLFFGNIVKNSDNYRELSDCALRIIPQIEIKTINTPDNNYNCSDTKYGYYWSKNMYNNVGYFNQEYYRFGVVFIYLNGTLSLVYNTIGGTLIEENDIEISKELFITNEISLERKYINADDFGWIRDDGVKGLNLNARGVCYINLLLVQENEIIGIKFNIPQEVIDFLKDDLGIRGLFFVRQKCVPNILALCYLLPMDKLLEAPVIKYYDNDSVKYITECFVTLSGKDREELLVSNNYDDRLYTYKYEEGNIDGSLDEHAYAAICPDFLLNQPYYNQIFNGNKFKLEKIISENKLTKSGRFYNADNGTLTSTKVRNRVTINSVTENVPTIAILDKVYKLVIGELEESFRFKYAEIDNGKYNAGDADYDKINKSTNIVRGRYSPYLAIYSDENLETGALYNIYQEDSYTDTDEFLIRMDSSEPFYSISDRYNFTNLSLVNDVRTLVCWRGDCYINTFTFRVNRNFNDPTLPNNDDIIDKNTWKDHYKVQEKEEWEKISRSDLNAVLMGSWITFKVRSAMNYALRSQDHSYVSEEALMGAPRSFYPRSKVMYRGENKMPDSYLYNDAYRASLGFKCYFTNTNINYIKNSFSNRIQYSEIAVQDSYKNNYRESRSTYFVDYSSEYGGIMKLIGFDAGLLIVFEHAIGFAQVNPEAFATNAQGELVFIESTKVLPEKPTIISDTIGSLWPESVIKTEMGFVYGVDTVAKKIWRVQVGSGLQILSDFKVNKFLIENITLGERELYPTIGLRNVKTHYNNNKKDVMFTFYDDVYKDEEKVWNLCYNEILGGSQTDGGFTTFYSWVPSYSENIDTQFFSFDRNTSKYLSLIARCNYSIPENFGVLVDSPVLKDENSSARLYYSCIDKSSRITLTNEDGTTSIISRDGEKDGTLYILRDVKFELEKDHWGNWEKYVRLIETSETIDEIEYPVFNIELKTNNGEYFYLQGLTVLLLYVTPYLLNGTLKQKFPTESIILTMLDIVSNPHLVGSDYDKPALITDFYLHGLAGIFDIKEDVYPTYWYGKYHPFEFEFVVNDKVGQLKIFLNLIIISNKAEPESFHFEIEGDNYEFSSDKRAMYFRLEETKELFLNLGSDILFNRKYKDIIASKNSLEQYYRGTGTLGNNEAIYTKQTTYNNDDPIHPDRIYPVENTGLVQQVKSTIFPLYYRKVDTYDNIYHDYREMIDGDGTYDFKNLSGSEIVWNRDLNLFNIVTHIKNSPIDLVGRLRGNSRYKEGKWNIQIPSITYMQKNEGDWSGNIPPIVVNLDNLPDDASTEISADKLPNIISNKEPWTNYLDVGDWTSRKETLIRDKWIKIRIRYSGKNLAVIHSLITLYNLSSS